MRKPATVTAVLASQNGSFDKGTVSNLATLPIKCKAAIDGRKLACILHNEDTDMEAFVLQYEAIERKYPFHRDVLKRTFQEAV